MIFNRIRKHIPLRLKTYISKLLCHKKVGAILAKIYGNRIPINGIRIFSNSSRITDQTKASIFWRIYERAEIGFVKRYLHGNIDVIELGSSIGVVSCHILRKLGTNCKFIAVEADKELSEILENNISFNSLTKNYKIIQKAIYYNDSQHMIAKYAIGQDNTSGSIAVQYEMENSCIDYVQIISLSNLIAENCINEYVLICDIEGAEAGLLMNDKSSLEKCRLMIIELHETKYGGKTVTISDMIMLAKNANFRLIDRHAHVFVFKK